MNTHLGILTGPRPVACYVHMTALSRLVDKLPSNTRAEVKHHG